MDQEGWARRWQVASERVLSGMRDWEAAHPAATFAEMEAAVEAQLARLRVQLLEDLAVARAARERQAPERPACPECGARLQWRGQHSRDVLVRGPGTVTLRRGYAVCPACGAGLFPPR